jgi:hypothetical protein
MRQTLLACSSILVTQSCEQCRDADNDGSNDQCNEEDDDKDLPEDEIGARADESEVHL